jgi:thiamine-monophosphate kinase
LGELLGEFDLIKRYFTPASYSADVLLGVGDDAAVLTVPPEHRLVVAVDTIVAGVHFPIDTTAADIAYRALVVNLSDMAAMGAQPRWFTLSLCMPDLSERWLSEFAESLQQLAARYDVQLIGGDTVKGPLNISIQILGLTKQDQWLTRAGAKPGDAIFISGVLGEAAGGLQLLQQPSLPAASPHREYLLERFYRPIARVELGLLLPTLASSAMDVSDGLLTDLQKLCAASRCGAHLQLESLPPSVSLTSVFGASLAENYALQGGDDYELLFTVPHQKLLHFEAAIAVAGVVCTQIGHIVDGEIVECYRNGIPVPVANAGFDHFAHP